MELPGQKTFFSSVGIYFEASKQLIVSGAQITHFLNSWPTLLISCHKMSDGDPSLKNCRMQPVKQLISWTVAWRCASQRSWNDQSRWGKFGQIGISIEYNPTLGWIVVMLRVRAAWVLHQGLGAVGDCDAVVFRKKHESAACLKERDLRCAGTGRAEQLLGFVWKGCSWLSWQQSNFCCTWGQKPGVRVPHLWNKHRASVVSQKM